MNFKNMGDAPPSYGGGGVGGGRPPGNLSLTRQPSVYSLTFDELQNSMGGLRKDFGSMNMDEFLKNIWTAEESQAMGMGSSFGGGEGGAQVGNLQRQGSITLPRTLSQKTVDEVWKDLFKENGGGKDGTGNGGLNFQQRQQTLGEVTLEEFLVRAGVVREDAQTTGRPDNNSAFYGELFSNNNNNGLALEFGQLSQNNRVVGNRVGESNNTPVSNQSTNLGINVNGVRSSQQQQQQQQQQQLFPKQPNIAYASQLPLGNNAQLASPGTRGPIVVGDPTVNKGLVPGGGLECGGMGMVCFGPGNATVAIASPANPLSSDGLGKSNGDSASLSPVPYMLNGGLRGKRCSGAVEKVVERRQRRMIKNRESAARSRARKQAYTVELEAEVAKLKEEKEKLLKKQVEITEMQENRILETVNQQKGAKKRCLTRTKTWPFLE